MAEVVYVWQAGSWVPYERKGRCRQCGKCCDTLDRRSLFEMDPELVAEGTIIPPEEAVTFFFLRETKDLVLVPGRGEFDGATFVRIVDAGASNKTAVQEVHRELGKELPGITNPDRSPAEDWQEISSKAQVVEGAISYRLLTKEEYEELAANPEVLGPKDEIGVRVYHQVWDPAYAIPCRFLAAPESDGRQLCQLFATALDYTDQAGIERVVHSGGGCNRPVLCQLSPISPAEIKDYECPGYTFVRIGDGN